MNRKNQITGNPTILKGTRVIWNTARHTTSGKCFNKPVVVDFKLSKSLSLNQLSGFIIECATVEMLKKYSKFLAPHDFKAAYEINGNIYFDYKPS